MKARFHRCLIDLPILYSFRRCPYAMRARMAIAVAGVDVETREVALHNKPDAMVAASPKATVPVLVLPDGRVIDESIDIMAWALRHHDPLDWSRARDDALIATNDGAFKHHLDRMKYPHRYDGVDAAHHYREGVAILRHYEAVLAESQFLGSDHATFTDIAIFPFVRQFARADMASWRQTPLPRTRNWLETLTQSPLFDSIMAKHKLWTEPGEPTTVRL